MCRNRCTQQLTMTEGLKVLAAFSSMSRLEAQWILRGTAILNVLLVGD